MFSNFTFAIVAVSILAASNAMATTVTGFAGADCTGSEGETITVFPPECLSLGSDSVKSFQYSGVPNSIQFFESGGLHDSCTHGSQLTLGPGSGCATAPAGFNWESVLVE